MGVNSHGAAALAPRGRYGPVVFMLVITIVVQAVPPDSAWERMVPVLVEGFTLLYIFWVSDVRQRSMVFAAGFIFLALLAAATATSASHEAQDWGPKAVGAIMALVGPPAIVRFVRKQGKITVQALFGALCIYLLAGLFFAYAFGAIASLSGNHFFAQNPARVDLNIDYIYFSFVTLTTVGYGDLTAAQSMGKMMAVSEALLGQLYLVGVVALLASNLGASFQGRLGRPPTEKDPADSGKSDAENRVS